MEMHLNLSKKTITSAAIATAAVSVLGALAFAYKKYCDTHPKRDAHSDETDSDVTSNIGPGEINPYADKSADHH